MTKEELQAFEQEIADEYCAGNIKAPIHLSDGNEEQLIEVFKMVQPQDWVYSTWRSHYHALLHGVPREKVKAHCMAGDSITLCFPEHRFFTSAIVGGIVPIATGTALALKRQNITDRHVWCFVGDMTCFTGDFYECRQYAENFDLPITFVIEDNDQSVGTPTRVVWGMQPKTVETSMPHKVASNVWRYDYVKKWPHVGAGKWVTF